MGREYARDLTTDEIIELKEFDAKMSEYQKYLTNSIQQVSFSFIMKKIFFQS